MRRSKTSELPTDPEELYDALRGAAYRALSYRALTAKELRQKLLAKKGSDPEMVTAIIAQFIEDKYIDEAGIVSDYIRRSKEDRPMGRFSVQYDLTHRGLTELFVQELLDELYPEEEEPEVAFRFAERRVGRTIGLERKKEAERIAAALHRRGFRTDTIYDVLRRLSIDENS